MLTLVITPNSLFLFCLNRDVKTKIQKKKIQRFINVDEVID